MRSLVLIRSADLVISIGGEIGTLYEIISAYACGKLLCYSGEQVAGQIE